MSFLCCTIRMMIVVRLLIFLIHQFFLVRVWLPIHFWYLWMWIKPFMKLYMKLVRHRFAFQCPSLHHYSISSCFYIYDAVEMTKSRRRSKSDLTKIFFYIIYAGDIKYLPPSFNGNVIFILSPLNMNVSSTHGHFMDDMDKICDKHFWCTTKIINNQNDFGHFVFGIFMCRSFSMHK